MFRNLWDALKKNPLLDESYSLMDTLNHRTQEMFLLSVRSLIEGDISHERIVRMDKQVNNDVQAIRKKVFEYFSVTTAPNIHGSLVLISLVIDYERIGDYSKDISYLRKEYGFDSEFDPGSRELIIKMKDAISLMFVEAQRSLDDMNPSYPNKVTSLEDELKEYYSGLSELVSDKIDKKDEAIVLTVSGRILRRIAGHLDNIGSAGVRPFPKLGFKPGASSWED